MPQKLADLRQGSTFAKQLRGQGVPQQMGALTRRIDTGAGERSPDDIADRHGVREASARRMYAHEHAPRSAPWPSVAQVVSQSLAHVGRDRQQILPTALPAHPELPGLPIDVIQRHGNHFSGPQAESREEKQDRVVALTGDRGLITAFEKTLDLLLLE